MSNTAAAINSLLNDLNASTEANAYSGLTAEELGDGMVKIFDDYDSGEYVADRVIAALESVPAIDWDEHDNTESAFTPVWDAIAGCEA
jgi:hypothetical protein